MCTASSSANLGALKITTLHITNLQDKWPVCGISCNKRDNPYVATWDNNIVYDHNIRIIFMYIGTEDLYDLHIFIHCLTNLFFFFISILPKVEGLGVS